MALGCGTERKAPHSRPELGKLCTRKSGAEPLAHKLAWQAHIPQGSPPSVPARTARPTRRRTEESLFPERLAASAMAANDAEVSSAAHHRSPCSHCFRNLRSTPQG